MIALDRESHIHVWHDLKDLLDKLGIPYRETYEEIIIEDEKLFLIHYDKIRKVLK